MWLLLQPQRTGKWLSPWLEGTWRPVAQKTKAKQQCVFLFGMSELGKKSSLTAVLLRDKNEEEGSGFLDGQPWACCLEHSCAVVEATLNGGFAKGQMLVDSLGSEPRETMDVPPIESLGESRSALLTKLGMPPRGSLHPSAFLLVQRSTPKDPFESWKPGTGDQHR